MPEKVKSLISWVWWVKGAVDADLCESPVWNDKL